MLRLFSWVVGVLGDVMDGNDQPYVGIICQSIGSRCERQWTSEKIVDGVLTGSADLAPCGRIDDVCSRKLEANYEK